MSFSIPGWVQIASLGVIGSLAYTTLKGWRPFGWRGNTEVEKFFDFGSLGDILVGSISAYLVWVTGLGNPNPPQSYALAIISGLTSSRVISDFVQKRILTHIGNSLASELLDDSSGDKKTMK